MFETFSTSALEMIDKALRIAKSLEKNEVIFTTTVDKNHPFWSYGRHFVHQCSLFCRTKNRKITH